MGKSLLSRLRSVLVKEDRGGTEVSCPRKHGLPTHMLHRHLEDSTPHWRTGAMRQMPLSETPPRETRTAGAGQTACCHSLEAKVRTDLKGTALTHSEWKLFSDGSCFRHPQKGLQSGYAVVRSHGAGTEVLEAEKLQGSQSAQRAEVLALIRALQLAEGKAVNIYTDSAYAVGAAHVELGQWLRAGFLTAGGKPIKHGQEMKDLGLPDTRTPTVWWLRETRQQTKLQNRLHVTKLGSKW
uniref:RNase H type-1 domain-containing protein n=2 Tax=Gasterosteus aculeatus aculeatus TaxID=481459 RepID=A0AAQ4S0Y0_GASAC